MNMKQRGRERESATIACYCSAKETGEEKESEGKTPRPREMRQCLLRTMRKRFNIKEFSKDRN